MMGVMGLEAFYFALAVVASPVISIIPLLLAFWWINRREERRANGQCVECGYSLTGNRSGVCPECGRRIGAGW